VQAGPASAWADGKITQGLGPSQSGSTVILRPATPKQIDPDWLRKLADWAEERAPVQAGSDATQAPSPKTLFTEMLGAGVQHEFPNGWRKVRNMPTLVTQISRLEAGGAALASSTRAPSSVPLEA
jgi:hypothetical protein